jgi:hypothetical protein
MQLHWKRKRSSVTQLEKQGSNKKLDKKKKAQHTTHRTMNWVFFFCNAPLHSTNRRYTQVAVPGEVQICSADNFCVLFPSI